MTTASQLERVQRRIMDAIIGVLVFLVLISLAWAALTVASDLIRSIGQPSFERFKAVTLEILTIFIFIEMFTLLLDYVKNQRLCLTNIVDATLAVVLRELWVQIWAGESAWELLLALSGVVVALAVLRVASMKYSVQEA
ncbi:MAG: hypothetical protein Kow0067_12480 [Coriobacteriia bacterium]